MTGGDDLRAAGTGTDLGDAIWRAVGGRRRLPGPSQAAGGRSGPMAGFPWLTRWQWVLLGAMLIAAFTRFVNLGESPLFHDEAYYWVWEQHIGPGNLELSFYDHPAGVAYLVYISTALFGDSEFGVRAIFAVIGVATVYLVHLLGRYLYDERTGALAALLMALNFGHIFLSRLAMNDVAATFMFILIVYLFARAIFDRSDRYLVLAGFALGIGFLVKYTVAVVALGFLAFLWVYPSHRRILSTRALALSITVAALLTLPFWIWNATHDWAGLVYQGGHASPFLGLFIGGDFFHNQVVSLTFYPMIWLIIAGVPLTILLIAGMVRTFRFTWTRERVALVVTGLVGMGITYAMGLLPITLAFEMVFWYGVYLAFDGFSGQRDALLGLTALVFVLFFAFSLGRMVHWVFPAFGPMSVLAARWLPKAYSRVVLNRRKAVTFAVVSMVGLNLMGAYAINGAYAMGNHGQAPDPKSAMAGGWVSSTNGTRDMGLDTAEMLEEHPGSVVLVPNWVTYSPVKYYLFRDNVETEIYTWVWDYQIGTVWERDVDNMPGDVDRAVIPVYSSSFLGGSNEDEIFKVLCYSPVNESGWKWWGSNDQTLFARTGFDHFVIERVGRIEYNTTFMWFEDNTVVRPYFVAYGERTGGENVTLVHEGMRYTAPKEDLAYEGNEGRDWLEVFSYESVEEGDQ